MKSQLPRLTLLAVRAAVCLKPPIVVQTTTSGGLTGVVTDQSNAVVPNAEIEIKDNSKGTIQLARTDREGVYRVFFLAPSVYTLTVSHDGFRISRRPVNVLLGPPDTVNVWLEIAKTSSDVTVTGEAPLLQAENGDASATMNQEQIAEVPNPGNDLTYILQTTPGTVMNTDVQGGANFSILGMPGTSYRYAIDGLNDTQRTVGWIAFLATRGEPDSGNDDSEHGLLRPVRRRRGGHHQLRHQVGRQHISRQRSVLLERKGSECQRLVQQGGW